jgi:hypothetical protein
LTTEPPGRLDAGGSPMTSLRGGALHALKQVMGHVNRGRIRTGPGLDSAEWGVAAAMCGGSVGATVVTGSAQIRGTADGPGPAVLRLAAAAQVAWWRPAFASYSSSPFGVTADARCAAFALGSPGRRVAVLACDVETVVL